MVLSWQKMKIYNNVGISVPSVEYIIQDIYN